MNFGNISNEPKSETDVDSPSEPEPEDALILEGEQEVKGTLKAPSIAQPIVIIQPRPISSIPTPSGSVSVCKGGSSSDSEATESARYRTVVKASSSSSTITKFVSPQTAGSTGSSSRPRRNSDSDAKGSYVIMDSRENPCPQQTQPIAPEPVAAEESGTGKPAGPNTRRKKSITSETIERLLFLLARNLNQTNIHKVYIPATPEGDSEGREQQREKGTAATEQNADAEVELSNHKAAESRKDAKTGGAQKRRAKTGSPTISPPKPMAANANGNAKRKGVRRGPERTLNYKLTRTFPGLFFLFTISLVGGLLLSYGLMHVVISASPATCVL